MVNVVLLHAPGDEPRAATLGRAWRGGRATLCVMGPHRRRIALGARSVLVGLWSEAAGDEDAGRQMASVLAQSAPRAMLAVWDGRPPLEAAAAAGVPIIVAPEVEGETVARLETAAETLLKGDAIASDMREGRAAGGPTPQGARSWGIAVGIMLGVLVVLGGLAPFAARLINADAAVEDSAPH